MSELQNLMIEKAKALLAGGEIKRIVGWKKGEFYHDPSPATLKRKKALKTSFTTTSAARIFPNTL